MNPRPTGRLLRTAVGRDLVLTRTFDADIDDVWASITESERTARWFASWTGDAGPGKTIRYRLTFEGDDVPESEMTIDVCDPPHHLAVHSSDEHGAWHLEAKLHDEVGRTVLTLVHHLDADTDVGSVGPGWEYYLDNLIASRDGTNRPDFNDYFPSQQAYFQGLDAE